MYTFTSLYAAYFMCVSSSTELDFDMTDMLKLKFIVFMISTSMRFESEKVISITAIFIH